MLQPRLMVCMAGLLLATAASAEISEGELRFLESLPGPPPHHHRKQISIDRQSLESGWVRDRQCHEHMDPVAALEIVFAPGKVRRLRVTRTEHIERAWIEGSSVQAANIGPEAVLCLESELRVLKHDSATGLYHLDSGPYMRRFLDGFFPLRLSLDIDYPADRLRLIDLQPADLRAKSRLLPGRMQLEVIFEGKLDIRMQFEPISPGQPGS